MVGGQQSPAIYSQSFNVVLGRQSSIVDSGTLTSIYMYFCVWWQLRDGVFCEMDFFFFLGFRRSTLLCLQQARVWAMGYFLIFCFFVGLVHSSSLMGLIFILRGGCREGIESLVF
jgi:hypothetical protein